MSKNQSMDYSVFFPENDAETTCVTLENGVWQVVLGHEKNNHHLLSVVTLENKYEVAVFKIGSSGRISNRSWQNPIVQRTFKFDDFAACRKCYKDCMEKYC